MTQEKRLPMLRPGLILACLSLAACAPQVETLPPLDAGNAAPAIPGAPDTCGAAGLQVLVGQRVELFEGQVRPGPKRILGPSDPATADFNPKRTTVYIDNGSRITRIVCG
jgi:hypothetical protein